MKLSTSLPRRLVAFLGAWLLVAALPAGARGEGEAAPEETGAFRTYKGGWFEIEHPADFDVRPSLASNMPERYDSAFFDSPDGSVSFYICSPQWSREPTDVALVEDSEVLEAREVMTLTDGTRTYLTIAAKDGSYRRSYQETELHEGSVRWVVGIRYRDKSAYDQHLASYLRFKKSLVQFAD